MEQEQLAPRARPGAPVGIASVVSLPPGDWDEDFAHVALPGDAAWQLGDYAWDPVAMLASRTPPDEGNAVSPAALVPLRAPASVALPAGDAAPSRKSRGRPRRPSVCLVPMCGAPLTENNSLPRYCYRFRICPMHLRAEEVLLPGGPARHCQKCSRFHPLAAFSGANRTCMRSLAEKAARRRGGARAKAPNDDDDALRFAFVDAFLGDGATLAPAVPNQLAAPPAAWASSAAVLPVVREASLKLGGATPGQLPDALAPALHAALCHDIALELEATPRPGCTLLHVDGLLPPDAPPAPDAAALAHALRAGPLRAWLAGRRLGVRCGGTAHPASSAALPPTLPRLRPAALLCTAPGELRAQRPAQPLPQDAALCGRLHGQNIGQLSCSAAADGSLRLTLPATGAEGAARFWLAAEGQAGGASRAVLLTSDAAIAAEVAAALDAEADADEEEQERLICALGAALRPGCPARVVAAAAHAALRRGWAATSARLLPAVRAALAGADADGVAAARTLLHAAMMSGDAQLVRLTMQHSGDTAVLGAPGAFEHGFTPMHLAAAAREGGAAQALATATPGALLSWFYARASDGTTPADVALATGGAAAETHALLRRRLEAARDIAMALTAGADGTIVGDAQLMELARFMLQVYAPSDDGPTSAAERALFYDHRMAARRLFALTTPPIVIIINLRTLLLPPLDADALSAVLLPAQPSFMRIFEVHAVLQQPFVALTVLINVVMLALAGLPALRGVYRRHGRAVLRAYCVFQFIARRTLPELWLRHTLRGNSVVWPSPGGALLIALFTLHMAAMPLPARDVVALLVLQWVITTIAHTTGLPLWSGTAAPLRDALLRTSLLAALAAVLWRTEARALAAWRATRRMRLSKMHVKQA